MEQRRFGSTGLITSPIGFGTWEMSGTMYGEIDAAAASRAVGAAIDHGITLFDTAAVYGPFHSERLLAKALGARRREVTLVTKVCERLSDDETLDWRDRIGPRDGSYEHTLRAAEGCLQRLATDVIDLLLIHHRDFDTPIAETIGALERLRADGKIRYYGVSNHDVPMLEECRGAGRIATNQLPFNLFDRRVEPEILPWCAANGVGFMSYGTLGFGLLTGAFSADTSFGDDDWRGDGSAFGLPLFEPAPFRDRLRVGARLAELAAQHGRTLAQLAIAWVLDHAPVTVALVGMRDERELRENIGAAGWKLSDEIRAQVDRIFAAENVPTYAGTPVTVRPNQQNLSDGDD